MESVSLKAKSMHRLGRRKSEAAGVSNMESFISCFSASSLVASPPESLAQFSAESTPVLPIAAIGNEYAYLPEQYWNALDYYDASMGFGSDLNIVRRPGALVFKDSDCLHRPHRYPRHFYLVLSI